MLRKSPAPNLTPVTLLATPPQFVTNKWYEYTMLFLILLSSLALCLDDSHVVKYSARWQALQYLDIFFVVVFGLEVST